MTGLARCCKPAPPDPIVGFVTRGKGISIHRRNCSNVARMQERHPERLITAEWGTPRDEVFPVDVVVEAMDRQALLRDVSEVFSREKINVTAVKTLTRNLQAKMSFTLEVKSLEQLKHALGLVAGRPRRAFGRPPLGAKRFPIGCIRPPEAVPRLRSAAHATREHGTGSTAPMISHALFNELDRSPAAYHGDPKWRFESAAYPAPYCYCAVHKPCADSNRPLREAKEQ